MSTKPKVVKMKTYKGSYVDELRGMRKMCMAFVPSYKQWIESLTKKD